MSPELGDPIWNGSRALNNGQLTVQAETPRLAPAVLRDAPDLTTRPVLRLRVLADIERNPGTTVAGLAARLRSTPGLVNGALYTLERHGQLVIDDGGEPHHRGRRTIPMRYYATD